MLSFARIGCRIFVGVVNLVVTVDQFLDFVDPYLHQEMVLDLPWITGQELMEVARAKKSTAGGLDGLG